MCKIKSLDECEKRVVVDMGDGKTRSGNWFSDDDTTLSSRVLMEQKERDELDRLLSFEGISSFEKWYVNYKKDEDDTYFVSRHAYHRLKERLGWNKKASNRMLKRVMDRGARFDTLPSSFRKWVADKAYEGFSISESRVFAEHLFLVDESSHILITVLPIPAEHRKSAVRAAAAA